MGFDQFIKKKVKKKKNSRTRLETEKLLKKQTAAAEDYLEAVGTDDEDKGARWTIEAQKAVEEKEKIEDAKAQDDLEKSRRSKKDYLVQAATKLVELAETIDWPRGYRYRVGYEDDNKLSLMFQDKKNNIYARGIQLTGSVLYDVNALHIIITQAENTVDQLEGRLASQLDIKTNPVWEKSDILKDYIYDKNSSSKI